MYSARAAIKFILSLFIVVSLSVSYGAYAQGDNVKATDHGISIKQTGGTINIGPSNDVIKWLMNKYDLKEKEAQTLKNLYEKEKKAHANSEKKLSELAEEYNNFKTNVSEIPENDPLKKEADKCLSEGDFECAKITLIKLRQKRIDKRRQDLARLNKNDAAIAQSNYMLARLAEIQYDTESASKYYLEAYELNPNDVNIAFYAGLFFAHHQEFDNKKSAAIERAYEIYLGLSDADQEKFAPIVSMTLFWVSIKYWGTIGFHKALNAGNRGMKLGPAFLSKAPGGYKQCVAMAWNILGNFYLIDKRFYKAEEAFIKALQKYRLLVEKGHGECLQDVAFSLGNLGNLYFKTGQFDKAIKAVCESADVYRKLAMQDADTYSYDLAITLTDLGKMYEGNQRFDDAKDEYNEALKIFRKKANKNTYAYTMEVANTLSYVGTLYRKTQQFDAAKKAYDEALSLCRKTTNHNHDSYFNAIPKMLTLQGNLYADTKNFNYAEKSYMEALKEYRALAEDDSTQYLPYIVVVKQQLSRLYKEMNRSEDARKASAEAEEIQRNLDSTRSGASL